MGGKTSNESKRKYNRRVYDQFCVAFKKETGAKVRQAAAASGMSLNGFIVKAVETQLAAADIPSQTTTE